MYVTDESVGPVVTSESFPAASQYSSDPTPEALYPSNTQSLPDPNPNSVSNSITSQTSSVDSVPNTSQSSTVPNPDGQDHVLVSNSTSSPVPNPETSNSVSVTNFITSQSSSIPNQEESNPVSDTNLITSQSVPNNSITPIKQPVSLEKIIISKKHTITLDCSRISFMQPLYLGDDSLPLRSAHVSEGVVDPPSFHDAEFAYPAPLEAKQPTPAMLGRRLSVQGDSESCKVTEEKHEDSSNEIDANNVLPIVQAFLLPLYNTLVSDQIKIPDDCENSVVYLCDLVRPIRDNFFICVEELIRSKSIRSWFAEA